MILRKPYAFFIKHFKLFHIIMEILIVLCINRTNNLISFFNEYIDTFLNLIGQNLSSIYVPTQFILLPIFIIIISIVILVVMIVKKKPSLFYIINIGVYVYSLIVMLFARSILNAMSIRTLDIRTVMLIRDFSSLAFIFQIFTSVIVLIRAVGFDIKKFDFRRDLKDIQIEEKDNEEFEVSLEIDKNNVVRNLRKKIRYFKYSIKENKLLFTILVSIIVLILSGSIFIYLMSGNVIYKQDKLFEGNNFSVQITGSYLVNTDYRGNLINKDYNYIVLKVRIKNNTNYNFGLDIASAKLMIDNYVYTPTLNNQTKFFDFGDVYQGENIGNEFKNKVFVYQIPKELNKNDMFFVFGDKSSNDSYFSKKEVKMKLQYNDLTGITSVQTTNINTEMNLTDSILHDYKFEINAFDIQKQYKLKYNFCIGEECFESYEYLNPSVSNYDKSLLKISGVLVEGKSDLDEIENLYDFIESFGTLSYTINGKKKKQNISFKEVTSKKVNSKNTYYIEVLDEVKNASNISIIFTIRNKNYEYILK